MKEECFDDDYLPPQPLVKQVRYFRRTREAKDAIQWNGRNLDQISKVFHMDATVQQGWVYLRCMISGALLHTIRPDGWIFYGEDGRLRVETNPKFVSKYLGR